MEIEKFYYIYAHYLDGKCIYIGSNCKSANMNRAYDLSNRNKKYAEITKNRKQYIKIRILKKFPDVTITKSMNGFILSQEMKYISKYKNKGEAICNGQFMRDKCNPMYGKHHTKEAKEKNRQSNLNYSNTNKTWYDQLSEDDKQTHKLVSGNAARGKIWIYKEDVRKYIKPEELDKYLKEGWIKGRPSCIISKGNKTRKLMKEGGLNVR